MLLAKLCLLGAEGLVAIVLSVPAKSFRPTVDALFAVTGNGIGWGTEVEISTFIAADLCIRCRCRNGQSCKD